MISFRSRSTRRALQPLLLVLLVLLGHAVAADTAQIPRGWEYRWGDSPFDANGVPEWTQRPDADAWQSIDFPSNPPGRAKRENVWFRVTLPDGAWRDPILYIFSVDLIVEVYQGGRRIYAYGEFDEQGRGRFIGWPWHKITLPAESMGQPLYFRVFSNYQDIGLWGEVKVMERTELLRHVIRNSLTELLIGGLSLIVALLALVAACMLSVRRQSLAIALLAGSAGGMAIGSCQARLLIVDHALFWDYLAAVSYFVTPVAMAMLLGQWFAGGAARLYRGIQLFFTVYLLLAGAGWASGWVAVSDTYPVFDALFLLALPLLLLPALGQWSRATRTQRAVFVAFVMHALVLLASMAVAHGLLPWALIPLSAGALGFSLVIVVASLREYARTREALQALNRSLELKVGERTAALEALAEQERGRVRVLEFEGQKRALLDEITIGLQRCDRLESALAVLSGSLARLCEPIAGALYVRSSQAPEWLRAAAWGAAPDLPHTPPAAGQSSCWTFAIGYEQPRCGRQELALLVLAVPADGSDRHQGYDRTMLHCLLKNGFERINLTLSIVALREELARFSYEDALTGLKNRRYLDEQLPHEIRLAQRKGESLGVIILDLDHFKRLNDAHGHAAGDEALRTVAEQLRLVFRQTDIVCRYGGEEFVVILPSASLEACRERAEALRQAVRAVAIRHDGRELGPVTLSAGLAAWPDPVTDPARLLAEADRALYLAKQHGRDRVELCTSAALESGDPLC